MAFDKAKEIVHCSGADVVECLLLCLGELKIRWVPQICIWQTKHPRASWDGKSYVEIFTKDRAMYPSTRVSVMEGRVLTEFERLGLCYSHKLERYRKQGMPWMQKCMPQLTTALTSTADWVTVLNFLSAIGLLENNEYVEYKALEKLLRTLPLTVDRLQQMLLLSKYLLPKGTPFKLWKLHETIPTRLPKVVAATVGAQPAKKRPLEEED